MSILKTATMFNLIYSESYFSNFIIKFGNSLTIISGEDGCGKTTILNSIRRTLGHSVTQLFNPVISDVNIILEINAIIEGENYSYKANGKTILEDQACLINKKGRKVKRDITPIKSLLLSEFKEEEVKEILKNCLSDTYIEVSFVEILGKVCKLMTKIFASDNKLKKPFKLEKLYTDHAALELSTPNSQKGVYWECLSKSYYNTFLVLIHILINLKRINPVSSWNIEELSKLEGIVLLDDIDEGLSPESLNRFLEVLIEEFKKVQFVVTTRSPSVLKRNFNEDISCCAIKEGTIYVGGDEEWVKELAGNSLKYENICHY